MPKNLVCVSLLLVAAACSSSSSSPSSSGDGGSGASSGGGGSSSGSHGSASGGGGQPACVYSLGGSDIYSCMNLVVNGKSTTGGPSDCTAQGSSFVEVCPTKNLVGCCTAPANGTVGNPTQEECYYNGTFEGGVGCIGCGVTTSDDGAVSFNDAAQQEAVCKKSGIVANPGTWSTTP